MPGAEDAETRPRVDHTELLAFARAALEAVGVDAFSVETVAEALCTASLSGNESHGVRLLPGYVDSARIGFMNPKPQFTVEHPSYPAFAVLDADGGFGLAAGCRAIDVGVKLAQQYGVATVVVKGSRHAGPMSAYTARAAAQGCIAFATTSTPPAMRMHNGTRPFLGTNPIAVGAPRPEGGPFSLDMATTAMANGKLAITAAADHPIPRGVIHRPDGSELTDAAEFRETGNELIETVGIDPPGPTASHKGFGLAAVVEVLTNVLTGQQSARENLLEPTAASRSGAPPSSGDKEARTVDGTATQWGQWFMVMKADGAIPSEEFAEGIGRFSAKARAEPQRPGAPDVPMLPGDIEERERTLRSAQGIPLPPEVLESLAKIGMDVGVELPKSLVAAVAEARSAKL